MADDRDDKLREVAQSWREHITRGGDVTFAEKDDKRRLVLAAGSQILRWFGLKTGEFQTMLDDVSFTLPPVPGLWAKPVVLMASRLEDSPLDDIETATHEWTHGRDLRRLYKDAGPLPAEVNYAILYGTELEARARCEGKAYVAGLYAKSRLSRRPFAPSEVSGRMHRLYMLGQAQFELVDDMTRSDVESIARAGAPPHHTAIEFGGWIEDTFPELLVAA